MSVICSLYAWFYFLALDLSPGLRLIPDTAGAVLQIVGITFQLFAKVSLGRSFGILPATRRLVTRGPYRFLRHPMYFGYLIAHIGFLFSNFLIWNVAVLAVLYAAQVIRMQREEE
ncbi:MAG: methyltransferase, partial [Rhodocyclaceae bacterium]